MAPKLSINLIDGFRPAVVIASGPDRPGVSAALFRVLAAHGSQLLDIEQSIFRGHLSLAALVGCPPHKIGRLRDDLVETLATYDCTVEIEFDDQAVPSRPYSSHAVVVLGNPVTAEHISQIGQVLADYGTNIDTYRGISDYPVTGVELKVSVRDPRPGGGIALRKALAELSTRIGVDIAIERAGLARRSKRLICFDCDSTLIRGEVIEMLAAHAGREQEVAEVTARAMRGEIDFEESLRERVATLRGLDSAVIEEVAKNIVLTPGARTTIRTLKRMGYRTAVVSGGFIQVIQPLIDDLDIDFVRANTLEIVDGKLTGKVVGDIVGREAKARYLKEFAATSGLAMYQTVAVGDGANDIDMLSAAGLGIAFNAKKALQEVADASVNFPFLDEVLSILGIDRDDVDAASDAKGPADEEGIVAEDATSQETTHD
ncbi:MAG TPA: phosphoserine phosphatase SerB [Corynebacterium kroppenstedtii]|nr:phosphoserine phosphatase SerB [Corynebacterium kroppenstedtii]